LADKKKQIETEINKKNENLKLIKPIKTNKQILNYFSGPSDIDKKTFDDSKAKLEKEIKDLKAIVTDINTLIPIYAKENTIVKDSAGGKRKTNRKRKNKKSRKNKSKKKYL